jgi:hypothetical protein
VGKSGVQKHGPRTEYQIYIAYYMYLEIAGTSHFPLFGAHIVSVYIVAIFHDGILYGNFL